ncbi:MAG: hypothetical protein ETSY1_34345 [Candidatus Entotheonella factor]|uniref:DUF7305 domain-containing protein n=1 Tax=Entotheonella factor TaxID=1429438 RepID=W4L8Y8_ENTF1|nr:MAG: hypothetical protein ETSY1_34345 [Candidatus Entotheonella factor]
MFIAVLTIAGSTAVTINSTDLLLGGAFQSSQAAFHNADSGVNYLTSQIATLVADGKLQLDGSKTKESYTFKKPSGFEFTITQRNTFKRIANTRKYLVQVTGRPHPNSPIKSTIEVVLQRRTALDYGLFAANRLDLPAQGRIYSYDSRLIESGHNPTTSTSIVQIATNGVVTAQAGHLDLGIDGDILLGETPDGDEAYFTFREAAPDIPPAPATVTVGDNHELNLLPGDDLPTDPLNIKDMISSVQNRWRRKNNNGRVLRNRDNRITTSFYLAKGNYYLNEITLGSGKFLALDAMRGDVNIYADSMTLEGNAKLFVLTGREAGNVNIYLGGPASFGSASASAQPGFTVTGDASTFRMFSSSNEPINLYHKGDFKGLIYAPYAPVAVRNTSAHGYGLLWSHILDFSMNTSPYTFYTNTALQEQFLSGDIEIVSWKELRD